jgi:hypothetical protein
VSQTLTAEIAARFAAIALGHLTQEYPNKLEHVLNGPQDVKGPRALHPIFCGSFDWHSCVHGHWLLARLLRRFPQLPEAGSIRSLLDAQFTEEKVAGELRYLEQPATRGFERPYGWAWALALQAELLRHENAEGRRWAAALAPLAKEFMRRFEAFLPLATYPMRAGVHSNTAFALLLAREYAVAARNSAFAGLCAEAALGWYRADRGCPAWEPSLDEFLSPALMEAALLADIMPKEDFAAWLAAFLPHAARGEPATLFTPATVTDRTDGKIAHLDGLNLSRAWCWRRIVADLPPADPLRARAQAAIEAHLASGLSHIAGDYAGEHWLATYALLALDDLPGG